MSISWKKYGGVGRNDTTNNITVSNIVADTFTLKNLYYGAFDVRGELHISGNANIDSNLFANNATIATHLTANSLSVLTDATMQNDAIIMGNLYVNGATTYFGHDLKVNASLYVSDQLFLGCSLTSYLYASDAGLIGINTKTPASALDLCSNTPFALNVSSNTDTNYSIIARNINNRGILVSTDSSSSKIEFFNNSGLNPTAVPDGIIQYTRDGQLILDVYDNLNVLTKMSITNRPSAVTSHLLRETVIIYDTSDTTGPYMSNIYNNPSETTGNALTLVANDASSNTFFNIVTPATNGLAIGGGSYPIDNTRSMGTFGLRNASGAYTPSLQITSGASNIRARSTVSVNTYSPQVDSYVLDINGPTHMNNGELVISNQTNFQVMQLSTSGGFTVAIGSPIYMSNPYRKHILYTKDSGNTWITNTDLSGTTIDSSGYFLRTTFVYNTQFAIVAGDIGYAFYTYNGGTNWATITGQPTNSNITAAYVTAYNSNTRVYLGYANGNIQFFDILSTANITNGIGIGNTNQVINNTAITIGPNPIRQINSIGNTVYVIDASYIYTYSNNNLSNLSNTKSGAYSSLSIYDANNLVAVGTNRIDRYTNGTWSSISLTNTQLNSVFVYDASRAVAVGNAGVFLYSTDGYNTWSTVPNSILNTSGNAARLTDPAYNLTNITMTDINTFLITKMISVYNASTQQYGNTSIFTAYYPNLFNNVGNYVLDISGSSRISGDININDGGKLASANPTFQLLNNTVKTIYMGGDASCILLGNTTSTVNTNSNLWINQVLTASGQLVGLSDSSLNGRLYVAKDASFNSNTWTAGTVTASGQLIGLFDTSLNRRLYVSKDASFNRNTWTAGTVTASGQLLGLSDASFSTNVWVNGNLQSNSYIKSANYESSDSNGNIYVGGSDLTGISTRQIYVGNFNSVPQTVNTINVGGVNDNIVVGASNGSLIINTPLKVAASRIYVNCGASGSITSSATSGLYIGDYQLPSGDFGYINVSNDRNGYVFCPTLAPKNKVKLDVSGLRVSNSTTYPNAGLMTLSRTPASTQIDSSYTIGVGSFDISNVTIRNLSTSTGYQQVIDTSFGILGQTSIGKYQNVIANAQLDISGNVNVSTFLGIGTTSVVPTVNNGWGSTVCALEISGNVYQPPGGYIWQF